MAKERGEFEIVASVKAKFVIWQHCKFVKVKDEVSKTKIDVPVTAHHSLLLCRVIDERL